MKINKIVARLKDRTLMKGTTSDFLPENEFFNMKLLDGDVVPVNIDKLKALFFVKTFEGNKNYTYSYKDIIPWGGNKVKVEFFDGEEMIGYTPYHFYGQRGFFLTPADLKGNNRHVFVVTSSTQKITFM
jgi:hypothetical protein